MNRDEVQRRVKKMQEEARRNIVARGKLEFRAEPKLMNDVLDLARDRMVAVGPMIRQWVKERVELELQGGNKEPTQLDTIEKKIDLILEGQQRKKKTSAPRGKRTR